MVAGSNPVAPTNPLQIPERGSPAALPLCLASALLLQIPMDSSERQVLLDLIAVVRTLANQTLTLHLQLGAVRALLARKGVVTTAELEVALAELSTMTAIDEFTASSRPDPDEVFDDLLRRLGEAA